MRLVVTPMEAAERDEPSQAPARASAVAAETKVYVQAGLLATRQPAGVPNHRVTPPLSGGTIGLAAAVGFSKHPTLALEGELVVPRRPFELVGGGVAINRSANRSIVVTRLFAIPPTPPTTEPDEVAASVGFALNGGVATPLPVSRRVEIVPAFTVRWVGRSGSGIGGYAGVGSYAYQVGATVRWTFD